MNTSALVPFFLKYLLQNILVQLVKLDKISFPVFILSIVKDFLYYLIKYRVCHLILDLIQLDYIFC